MYYVPGYLKKNYIINCFLRFAKTDLKLISRTIKYFLKKEL